MKSTSQFQRIKRRHLDARFSKVRKLALETPKGGWIRAIREALGMSLVDLGRRLGLAKQNVKSLENSEAGGTITVSTLKRVADALACDIRILLVPRRSLEEMVRNQAAKIAERIVKRTDLQMSLEKQGTSISFQEPQIREIADELVRNMDRRLWEDEKL